MQNCGRPQTTCNMHETADNRHYMQHSKDNRQRTTVSNHDTIRGRQHATYDKQRQTTRNNATDTTRRKGQRKPRGRRSRGRVPAPACFPRSHSTIEHSMLRHAAMAMPSAAMRTYAHAGRVARGARSRCTHLHPRRTASMPRSPDALFASAWLVASRIVGTSEGGQ